VTGQINYPENLRGIDAKLENNTQQVSYLINKKEEELVTENFEACETAVADNQDDDSRTKKNCLKSDEPESEIYFDDSMLFYTDIPRSSETTENLLITTQPLRGFIWGESGDKACELVTIPSSAPGGIDICEIEFINADISTGTPTERIGVNKVSEVITGIQVCRNAGDNRFKGLKLRVKNINENGELSTAFRNLMVEKTNCAEWTEWDYCPGNTIARGLRVWVKDGTMLSPRKFIHSLDLVCGTPVVRKK